MTSLEVFGARSNFLSGTIPSQLSNLRKMWYFGVSGNRDIHGDIGDVLNSFTAFLGHADISNLTLNGTLPANVGRFQQILTLWLHNNQIEGTLPDSVGLMTALSSLQIAGNKMNGTVPTDLGRLIWLSDFEMDKNSFVGSLPPQMSNLRRLESADISENELTGSLTPLSGIGTLREFLFVVTSFIVFVAVALLTTSCLLE